MLVDIPAGAATLRPALVDVGSLLEGASGGWQYVLVFVLTMVPAIEPFVVIPAAIGLGLDPVLTGLAAFAGSVTIVGAIVLAQRRLLEWWASRTGSDPAASSDRYDRARRLWERYGLAGLAFAGPILAGIHLTALLAATAGSNSRTTIAWLAVGLAAWTVALVAGSVLGFSALGIV